jgi:hypothetical protein
MEPGIIDAITEAVSPIVATILLGLALIGWGALAKVVKKTPNKFDDALFKPLDLVFGTALRAWKASKEKKSGAPTDKKPDE